jgi:hypothetical protein
MKSILCLMMSLYLINGARVTEAYLPYDETLEHYKNSLWLENQTFDRREYHGGRTYASKTYLTDMMHEGGLIIWISDPDAEIAVISREGDDAGQPLWLAPIEEDSTHKCVYTDESEIGRVMVVISSPHIHRPYKIGFVRYHGDPT